MKLRSVSHEQSSCNGLFMDVETTEEASGSSVLEMGDSDTRRQRRLTEKGLSYSMQQMVERRSRMWKSVNHKMRNLSSLMKSSKDVKMIESELADFNVHVAEFEDVCSCHRDLVLDSGERDGEADITQSINQSIVRFKIELYEWLRVNKKPDNDAESMLSGCSSRNSVMSIRSLDRKAKLAALSEQTNFSEREAELEHQSSILQRRARELQLEKEMTVTRAELLVYEEFDGTDQEAGLPLLSNRDVTSQRTVLEQRQPSSVKHEGIAEHYSMKREKLIDSCAHADDSKSVSGHL